MSDNPRKKFTPTVTAILFILAVMTGLVIYSPTLYKIFCAVTGFGGTVRQVQLETSAANKVPAKKAAVETRKVRVLFDSNVEPGLGWTFRPGQHQVEVEVGKPTKVYYYAKNNTDQSIVARAVYNVTPYKVAPYFFKIECFCFTEERLGPGQEAKMPLVFYLDKQFLKQEDMEDVKTITLSYTFYRQKDLSPEEINAARDLKKGSEEKEQELKNNSKTTFENDAMRQ